jgi:phenylpropionate dioxygenase-like ring-hydroxylating dioxygenase large terminal subunit
MTDLVERTGLFLNDAALIERILNHVAAHTTDEDGDGWEEPVENYRSEPRLAAEVALLRRLTIPFCPSAALPGTGSYVARLAAGVPIVAVRDRDGAVRAFRNACRHRGTSVAEGSGCAVSFVCPFHGWVYRLDGTLRHVPDAHGFPTLDPAESGLVPVGVAERGGLVFVAQDEPLDAALLASVPDVVAPDQVLLDWTESVLDVNWKVFTEGFLEGYHIKATHPQTFLPFGYDNLNVIECHGRLSRVTFPFRRIEALRDTPRESWRLDGKVTTVHHVFPNVIVARLSHHTTVAVLEPITVDQTRLVSYRLTNRPPDPDAAGDASRDFDFVQQGIREDQAVAKRVQVGLVSGANRVLRFGRFEGALTNLHRQLHELLGD